MYRNKLVNLIINQNYQHRANLKGFLKIDIYCLLYNYKKVLNLSEYYTVISIVKDFFLILL